jgi:uncharacterized membrane protein HdeD (DUF308 family)
MSIPQSGRPYGLHQIGLDVVRQNWGWFVALGIALILLGMVVLEEAVRWGAFALVVIGVMLLIGGILEVVHAFWRRGWSGFFVDLLGGLLYAVAGVVILEHPLVAEVALTLVIAVSLIFGGAFRVAVALSVHYHHWIWLLLSGLISILLGASILSHWPLDGLWVIGLFIGIDMIFNGWSLVMLGLAGSTLPAESA